ncbi:glycosyltransferase family 2 protein [Mucilaginibacter sp.]
MKPLFSIIIPLFNSSATLPFLLDSIVLQHYRNFELVFIDGASTDNTLDMLADFERVNNNLAIVIHSRPDKGIYDAMNRGIERASGEWLYFIGSDDRFCDGDVLRVIKSETAKGDADLIYGNVEGISSKTRYVYDSEAKVLSHGIHHQSVFYRCSLFDDLGKYNLSYSSAADFDFTLKVFLNDKYKIRYINKDIVYYGESGFSASNFDYKFFSGHYRLLALHDVIGRTENPAKCLSDSIYCCYYLAQQKKDIFIAWRNLIFYLLRIRSGSIYFRTTTFLNMLKRTIRRPLNDLGVNQ